MVERFLQPVQEPSVQITSNLNGPLLTRRQVMGAGLGALLYAILEPKIEKAEDSINPQSYNLFRVYSFSALSNNNIITVGDSIGLGLNDDQSPPTPAAMEIAHLMSRVGNWGYDVYAKDGADSPDATAQIQRAKKISAFSQSPHNELIISAGANDAMKRLFGDTKFIKTFQSGDYYELFQLIFQAADESADAVMKTLQVTRDLPIERLLLFGIPDTSRASLRNVVFSAFPAKLQTGIMDMFMENEVVLRPALSTLIRVVNSNIFKKFEDFSRLASFQCSYLSLVSLLESEDFDKLHPNKKGEKHIAKEFLSNGYHNDTSLYELATLAR